MSKFEESRWTNSKFSQNYRDEANIYLPFRREFIEITKSLYAFFFDAKSENNVLDLGCGDGLFIEELLKTFSPKSITLVDGSNEMLEAAQKRLGKKANINFIQASFQNLFSSELLNQNYDFVYSSLAIHHLPLEEKTLLYSYIYKLLSPSGCFVHYDVVAPVSTKIENWFLALWRQWIREHPSKEMSENLLGIPDQYKKNTDNLPDTLDSQLQVLTQIGFKEVDCFFKHGIFSLFGGFK
jgi:tRNA (cmo5U34)-methyltransferase